MNALDRSLEPPAALHYGDGDYTVLRPGRYVVCAVSGRRVPLEELRYWSVERQEAYSGAREAVQALVASSHGGRARNAPP